MPNPKRPANTPPDRHQTGNLRQPWANSGKNDQSGTKRCSILGDSLPIAQGARIRLANAKLAVTDGPFIESMEVIGGYAILRTKSKEEAVQCGKDFLQIHLDILGPSFGCEMEVRQMFDPSECGAEVEKR